MYKSFHGEIQHGEHVDQTLKKYFDSDYVGVFFDVGAYEPINISNSYHFEQNGWDVHCFEANPVLIPELKKYRKNVYNYAIYNESQGSVEFNSVLTRFGGGSNLAGISAVELDDRYMKSFGHEIKSITKFEVPQKSLNDILANELINIKHIDIMSVDVEGGELKVLQGLDINQYKPTVLCIENLFNDSIISEYLLEYDYKLDKQIEYNQYYVLK